MNVRSDTLVTACVLSCTAIRRWCPALQPAQSSYQRFLACWPAGVGNSTLLIFGRQALSHHSVLLARSRGSRASCFSTLMSINAC